jgi:hypothetical protein
MRGARGDLDRCVSCPSAPGKHRNDVAMRASIDACWRPGPGSPGRWQRPGLPGVGPWWIVRDGAGIAASAGDASRAAGSACSPGGHGGPRARPRSPPRGRHHGARRAGRPPSGGGLDGRGGQRGRPRPLRLARDNLPPAADGGTARLVAGPGIASGFRRTQLGGRTVSLASNGAPSLSFRTASYAENTDDTPQTNVPDGGIRDRPNDIDVAVNQAQMTLIGFRLRRRRRLLYQRMARDPRQRQARTTD